MRITTGAAFDNTVNSLQRRQQELMESQQRMTTGKRINKASDDPTGAARAERALAAVERLKTQQRALEASRNAMAQSEGALADAGELLQQARESLVAAGNGTYSDAERATLAKHLRGLREQLLVVANRPDGGGSYIFGGQAATDAPFVDAPGGVRYRGVAGSTRVATDEHLPLTMDGEAVWFGARTGNGVFETRAVAGTGAWVDAGRVTDPSALTGSDYSIVFSVVGQTTTYSVLRDGAPTAVTAAPYEPGKAIEVDGMAFTIQGTPAGGDRFDVVPSQPGLSVFDTLDRVAAALETPFRTRSQVQQSVQHGLRDVDSVLGTMQSLRAVAGESLNRADALESRVADSTLTAQTERAAVEDLDMAAAISDFQTRQSGYDAALKSYSLVQRMSLLQYLNG